MSLLSKLWARRRDRPLLVGVAALVLGAILAYPFLDGWLQANVEDASSFASLNDFGAYTRAVDRWQEGKELYRQRSDGSFWGTFLYPPVVILLFVPFTELLDFRPASLAWVGTTGLLLWVGLQWLVSELGHDFRWWERLGLAWVVAGFHPVVLTAKMGQTSLFMGAMLSFAGAAMIRGARESESRWALVSGACTAVIGIVKFAYAPVGAHLLSDRRRMLGALAVVPPVLWLSIRLFPVEAHWTYIEVLQWGVQKGGDSPRSPTLWLPPYFKPLSGFPAPQAIRFTASFGVIVLALLAPARAHRHVFALGVAAFPLLTPQTYTYYLVALLPAATILLAEELRRDGYPEIVLFGVLFAHLHAYGLNFLLHNVPDAFPVWEELLRPHYLLLQPGMWGCVLLVGIAAVRVAQTVDRPVTATDRLDWADRVFDRLDRASSQLERVLRRD